MSTAEFWRSFQGSPGRIGGGSWTEFWKWRTKPRRWTRLGARPTRHFRRSIPVVRLQRRLGTLSDDERGLVEDAPRIVGFRGNHG